MKLCIMHLPGFQSTPPFYFFIAFVHFCFALKSEACLSSVQDLYISIIHVPDEATWSH